MGTRAGLAVAILISCGALASAGRHTPDTATGAIAQPPIPAVLDTIRCARRDAATATEVAVIDFFGFIDPRFNSDGVYRLLNEVALDGNIGAVALRIHSAGGDSYSANKLYEAVRKLKSTCAIPVASFIGNVGTSGAFWIAMATDEVHADPLSTVGGIGIITLHRNDRAKLAKEGTVYTVIRTGMRKWPLIPYLPIDAKDVEKIESSQKLVLAEFLAAVENARAGKLKLTREQLATGEAWMGRDAFALGLVDEPEDVDTTMRRLVKGLSSYRFYDLSKAAVRSEPPAAAPPQVVTSGSAAQ